MTPSWMMSRVDAGRRWVAEGPPWRRLAALALVIAFGWLISLPIRTGDDTRNLAQRAQGAAARARELVDAANAAAALARQQAADLQRRIDEITAALATGQGSPDQVASLKRELVDLQSKIATIATSTGKPGPQGPPGPRGQAGANAPAPAPSSTSTTSGPPAPSSTTTTRPTTTTTRPPAPTTTTTRPCLVNLPGLARVGC